MSKFRIGERVEVIDCRQNYGTYIRWFDRWGKEYRGLFNGKTAKYGRVVAIGSHEHHVRTLYAIMKSDSKVFLMDEKGLKSTKKVGLL